MKDRLAKIVARELDRIDELSEQGPLDIEDCKRLEVLTRSLKQLEDKKVEVENPFEGLSSEDLLLFVKGEPNDGQTDTKPKAKRKAKGARGDSEENGLGHPVAEG